MEKYIVTSYEHPDLDGISSMYAYSEYLNKTGKESEYYVRENIKTEPHIVCDMFGIELDSVDKIEKDADIVLVDSNNPKLVPFVNENKIVEIIDRHKLRFGLPEYITYEIEEIFRAKSVFKSSLKDEVEAAIPLKCGDIRMTVGQLEIVDAEKFIADNKKELIEVCNYLIDRFKYDCLIINIIDTIGGYSILFSPNENTDKFIRDKFGHEIKNNIYRNSKLVQRKEIIRDLYLTLAD